MPELPEVETYRRKLEKSLKGKKIKDIEVRPDNIVFEGRSPAFVKKALVGGKIKKLNRKGKYLWFDLNTPLSPIFHLGMTGSYLITDEKPDMKMKSIKLVLEMQDGTFMVFKDPRRFGRIIFLEDPLKKKPLEHLGRDVLNELPPLKEFKSLFENRKAPVKAILLDQSILSGIGNWMADEILFQSGIAPQRLCNTLTAAEFRSLHQKVKSVTKLSVNAGADDEKYPKRWLFHHRWGRKSGVTSEGDQIKHSTVGGRSTAWVPKKQK